MNVLILLDGGDSNLIIPNKLSMLAIPSTTPHCHKTLLKLHEPRGKDARKHSYQLHGRVSTPPKGYYSPACPRGQQGRSSSLPLSKILRLRNFWSLRVVGGKDVSEKVLLAHVKEQALRQTPMCNSGGASQLPSFSAMILPALARAG